MVGRWVPARAPARNPPTITTRVPACAATTLPGARTLSTQETRPRERELAEWFRFTPQGRPLAAAAAAGTRATGLFGRDELQTPADLLDAAGRAQGLCHELTTRVLDAHAQGRKEAVALTVRRLDRLSDALCLAVDAAEVLRHVHPDEAWVAAAHETHVRLSGLLNTLNTHEGLYSALGAALRDSGDRMGPEERRVGELLARDFEKSAIHLPDATRRRLVNLQAEIAEAGQRFAALADCSDPSLVVALDAPAAVALNGVSPHVAARCRRAGGLWTGGRAAHVPLGADPGLGPLLLAQCGHAETRRRVFAAMHGARAGSLESLQQLLQARHAAATLAGHASFGDLWCADAMVRRPEAAVTFLASLAAKHRVRANAEMDQLAQIKAALGGAGPVEEADVAFLRARRPEAAALAALDTRLAPFLSVGAAISGLGWLFERLFGVELRPATPLPGETWHADVRKLQVYATGASGSQEHLGDLYLDLFARDGGAVKYGLPAHFSVQCSRSRANDEPLGLPEVFRTGSSLRQRPIIVVVTNFARGPGGDAPLSTASLETLFHEMGHAMHSMLGQTQFQHVSGTRTQMDLVEAPSTVMELFLRSRHVLSRVAWSPATGAALPPALAAAAAAAWPQRRSPLDAQFQLVMSLLDLACHSELLFDPAGISGAVRSGALPETGHDLWTQLATHLAQKPADGQFATTRLLHAIQSLYHPVAPTRGTAWEAGFAHLYPYGSSYYSYAWCRRWAFVLVRKLFPGLLDNTVAARDIDAVLSSGGSILGKSLLAPGGSRDGWELFKSAKVSLNEGDGGIFDV